MNTSRAQIAIRLLSPVVLLWLGWLVGTPTPSAQPVDAPSVTFSATRAAAVLERILATEVPHPASSAANTVVQAHVTAEFTRLGLAPTVVTGHGCHAWGRLDVFVCGTVQNIVVPVFEGEGPALVLMAHYDSVPAGPGAADDLSGVAAILETIRALQASGVKPVHPVVALITDGEEAGLLGAAAFRADAAAMKNVGAVINVEARGNEGQSSLFQTSPGDGPLVDLYASAASTPMSSSLATIVYKLMPNDTDLTMFEGTDALAFNFAFMKNVAHYHTPLDTRANLNLRSLQHQGDNLLGVARALLTRDFASLKGDDAIYLPILGLFLPRLPMSWALPLALVAAVLVVVSAFVMRRAGTRVLHVVLAGLAPLVLVIGSALAGWGLHALVVKLSGAADPSFAHPWALRLSLCFGVATAALLSSRLADQRLLALSVWWWLAGLAVLTAAKVAGLSPYFLFPLLVGAPVLLLLALRGSGMETHKGSLVLLVAAVPGITIFTSLARTIEPIQGLLLHPAFTIPMALASLAILPVLGAHAWSRRAFGVLLGASVMGALGLALVAAQQPPFSEQAPQRLNVLFVDDHATPGAQWALEAAGTLPEAVRAVASCAATPVRPWPSAWSKAYLAPAGAHVFDAPTAQVVSEPEGSGRRLTVTLGGTPDADRLWVVVPKNAGLTTVGFQGQTYTPRASAIDQEGTVIGCMTRDCPGQQVTLQFDSLRPVTLWLGEQQFRLPPQAQPLVHARPSTATPQHVGDATVIGGPLLVP